jgi:endonuclease YncB( thermonuclease family)
MKAIKKKEHRIEKAAKKASRKALSAAKKVSVSPIGRKDK